MAWEKYRFQMMNEYFVDMKKMNKDVEEIAPTKEEYLTEVIRGDPFDVDEQPTHRMKRPDGTYDFYYAASKNFTHVDPDITDRHSLHYAPNHYVYFLLKNKKTKEWEFPTRMLKYKQTALDGKNQLFESFTKNKWGIGYAGSHALISTYRFLDDEERRLFRYNYLNGVRTFYFGAYHKNGIPEIDTNVYEDFAWVPKPEINKFLARDYFDEFKYTLWSA